MAKVKSMTFPALSDCELKMIRKMEDIYCYDYCPNDWRSLLDQWHWWSANWRKYPGYFLGEVAALSFDVFLARQDIAKRGFPIYEKMSRKRRGGVSRTDARVHD